jgi:hypothetical protein
MNVANRCGHWRVNSVVEADLLGRTNTGVQQSPYSISPLPDDNLSAPAQSSNVSKRKKKEKKAPKEIHVRIYAWRKAREHVSESKVQLEANGDLNLITLKEKMRMSGSCRVSLNLAILFDIINRAAYLGDRP